MNCKRCGFLMEKDARECPFCHAAVQDLNGAPVVTRSQDGSTIYQSPTANENQSLYTVAYQYPMKWYRFLTRFLLVFGAVLNFISAFACFVMALIASQPMLMAGAGIISIICGILGLVARSHLVDFKRSGPAKLASLHVWNTLFSVVYTIAGAITEGDIVVDLLSTIILSVVVNVIMIMANKAYFKKRAELFCN